MSHQDPAFFTEKELAERHRRSVKTLRNERLSGRGVPFVKIGRNVRYRLDDVERFERENLRRSTSDAGGDK
jgi:hypothetical protein